MENKNWTILAETETLCAKYASGVNRISAAMILVISEKHGHVFQAEIFQQPTQS